MNENKREKWEVTKSEHLVKDRWISLRADDCVTFDGRKLAPYYVLEYPEWVNCLVIDDDGMVTLLKHYRHGVQDTVLEIIGGATENENPDDTIARELEEEIGLIDAEIHKVITYYANPANQTNKVHGYVALGGTFDGETFDEIGAEFEVVRMPLRQLLEMIETQATTFQGLHLATIFAALNFLRKQGKKYD
jgi:8-oxo-dGTP pyrophosphatase MutT (NUDIX family)